MKRNNIFISALSLYLSLVLLLIASSLPMKSARPNTSFKELQKNFINPDMIYAPFAFWFWDANLDSNLIIKMAREMSAKGLNPGYIHGREGMPPEQWISPLWFQSFDKALKQAKLNNTYLGFCDEYWWPSGRANGKVLDKNPDLRAKSLKWRSLYGKRGDQIKIPSSLFVTAAKLADSNQENKDIIRSGSLKIIGSGSEFFWTVPDGSWKIYVFNSYFHGGYDGGDVNYLDKRLATEFIDIAHKPYLEFSDEFGIRIPGVFVDHEGDYGWKLAWSNDLEKDYKHKKGIDIRERIPLLIDEDIEGNWVAARYDWFDVVSDIYANSFLGTVSDYLQKKGLYTISNLWEENLYFQALNVGDAYKAHRAVTMPGNDCLFSKALYVHDFKEIQSISEFENTRFQSEILGVAGWEMSPILMKKAVNSVVCWGGSHIVPHGINLNRSLDSIPFPPDWFTSNPYWKYIDQWTDFTRRASFINSHGYTAPDVLVLNPMSSIWALIGSEVYCDTCDFYESPEELPDTENYNRLRNIDRIYSDIIQKLTSNRVEFLIADEFYLNQMKISEKSELSFTNYKFKQLLLPDLFCLQKETAQKILSFAAKGGKIYYIGELPSASSDKGLNDREFVEITKELKKYAIKLKDPSHQFQSHIDFVSGSFPMTQLHRVIDGRHFFWLVNNSDNTQKAVLKIKSVNGFVTKWDCETGDIRAISSTESAEGILIDLSFQSNEAFWLVVDSQEPSAIKEKSDILEAGRIINLNSGWIVSIDSTMQPEVFPGQVKFPQYFSIASGKKQLETWEEWGMNYFTGFVDYSNNFYLDLPDDTHNFMLNLGKVYHMAEVEINGISCGKRLWPPFKFDITDALVQGENTIKVRIGNLLINYMNYLIEKNELFSDNFYLDHRLKNYNPMSGMIGPVILSAY